MRIAILNDPNNFHTQKWAMALAQAGAEVIVMSYDRYEGNEIQAVQLTPPLGRGGRYSYLDYVRGGKVLREALRAHAIDVVNPLNITPFAVWAAAAGVHPVAACAFGADILEYPPAGIRSAVPTGRQWESTEEAPSTMRRWSAALKRKYFRRRVAQALGHADFITGDNQHLVDCMHQWFQVPLGKLAVLRWGVEPQLFAPEPARVAAVRERLGIAEGQRVVLSPRGAKPIYQADIILEAFGQLLADGPQDVLYIQLGAGYGISPQVAAQAARLTAQYPGRFRFVPEALTRADLHALWTLAGAFVSAPVYDGYSAALAEGRYAEAIPIVNDIPAHRELIVHGVNGWVTHPFQAANLAKDLRHVLMQFSDLKAQFGAINRAWIEEHSLLQRNAERFLEHLRERFGLR